MDHKQMASSCFNNVWDLLDKEKRTAEENEEMIHLCHASFWHWTQVENHTPQNISIGYWQLSRVYAVTSQGENALQYAEKCLSVSDELAPFFLGYAYEAIARAYSVLNQEENSKLAKEKAYAYAEKIQNEENKKLLIHDLEMISL